MDDFLNAQSDRDSDSPVINRANLTTAYSEPIDIPRAHLRYREPNLANSPPRVERWNFIDEYESRALGFNQTRQDVEEENKADEEEEYQMEPDLEFIIDFENDSNPPAINLARFRNLGSPRMEDNIDASSHHETFTRHFEPVANSNLLSPHYASIVRGLANIPGLIESTYPIRDVPVWPERASDVSVESDRIALARAMAIGRDLRRLGDSFEEEQRLKALATAVAPFSRPGPGLEYYFYNSHTRYPLITCLLATITKWTFAKVRDLTRLAFESLKELLDRAWRAQRGRREN